jgi:hypothetical protein
VPPCADGFTVGTVSFFFSQNRREIVLI